MTERPSGAVTFLFSDIEGSTRLLRELGVHRFRGARADHRRLVREAIAAAGGTEIDTQGDSFFVAFPRAEDAARAAVDIQRRMEEHLWPDDRHLRIRMAHNWLRPSAEELAGAVVADQVVVGELRPRQRGRCIGRPGLAAGRTCRPETG